MNSENKCIKQDEKMKPKLKDLCFEVIQTCPNRCKFCSSNSSIEKSTIITFKQFKKTIDFFISHGGIGEISISGGEPFLHPDIFDMIKYCKDKGIRTVLFTSGIKRASDMTSDMIEDMKKKCEEQIKEIDEHEPWNERLKRNVQNFYDRVTKPNEFSAITLEETCKLKELGLDKIVFDWQAVTEKKDNELMGRNACIWYLMQSIIRAKKAGLNIDVHFIPMKPNYKEFQDLMECLKIAEIEKISILNFVPQARGRENEEELMLSQEEFKEFAEIVNKEREWFSGSIRIGIPLNGKISHLCTAGTEKLDIRYDGTILPCPAFKEISVETMEKYGIKLHSIYEDLENVVVTGEKRTEPLCKQVYGFKGDLTEDYQQLDI